MTADYLFQLVFHWIYNTSVITVGVTFGTLIAGALKRRRH